MKFLFQLLAALLLWFFIACNSRGAQTESKIKYKETDLAATDAQGVTSVPAPASIHDGKFTPPVIVKDEEVLEAQKIFFAAVASFGMLLRNSEFKQHANYQQVVQLAKGAKGADENGYRQEFINLVQAAGSLTAKK